MSDYRAVLSTKRTGFERLRMHCNAAHLLVALRLHAVGTAVAENHLMCTRNRAVLAVVWSDLGVAAFRARSCDSVHTTLSCITERTVISTACETGSYDDMTKYIAHVGFMWAPCGQ